MGVTAKEGYRGQDIVVQQPQGQQAQGIDKPLVDQVTSGQMKRSLLGRAATGRAYSWISKSLMTNTSTKEDRSASGTTTA